MQTTPLTGQSYRPGYFWARKEIPQEDYQIRKHGKKYSRWVIVHIWGNSPFLKARVAADFLPKIDSFGQFEIEENEIHKWQFAWEVIIPLVDFDPTKEPEEEEIEL